MSGRKNLKYDVVLNIACAMVITLTYMWVIREAGKVFVPATLGLFLFTRRLTDSVSNLLQLGTSQTIRRYLAMSDDAAAQFMHIAVNLGIFFVAALIFSGVLLADLTFWTRVVCPEQPTLLSLTFWVGMFSVASVLGYFASSTLLAFRQIKAANFIDVLNTSGWLLVAMWWRGNKITVEQLFVVQTVGIAVLSATVLLVKLVELWRSRRGPIPWHQYRWYLKEAIGYGLPRSVTPFLEASLLVIGPWLIRNDLKESGYLIMSFTFLRIGRMFVQPAALVIGIAVAKLVGQNDLESLKKGVSYLFGTVMYAGFFLFAVLLPWTWLVLDLWLGNKALAESVLFYTTVIFFAMPPLAIAQALKEPIEMIWKRPFYLVNLAISLVIIVVWFYFTRDIFGPARSVLFSYVLVYWVNCFMSIYWLRKYLEQFQYYGIYLLTSVVLVVAALNWSVSQWASSFSPFTGVCAAIGTGVLSLAVMVGMLYYSRSISLISDVKHYLFAVAQPGKAS